MKKTLFILAAGFICSTAVGQVKNDTVYTQGNTVDVFYSLNNDEVGTADRTNWDIALENKGFAASILINGQKGVALYSSPFLTKDWATFDSAGYSSWPSTINSRESWSEGAFNQNLASDFDLGWGVYNPSNHVVSGDSIFLIGLADGSFKKIYVNNLDAGVYKFTYADVDGSNEQLVELKKTDIGTQNFGYYSIENEKFEMREPDTESWDLVFTQYLSPVPVGGGQFQNYPVSGVKINKGVLVAQRDGMDVMSDDTMNLSWSGNITEIGSDWKMWNGTAYEYAEDRAYFIKLSNGAVWKIYFTKYEGGPVGAHHFTTKKIASGVGIEEIEATRVNIYPNPSNGSDLTVALENGMELVQVEVYNSAMQLISTHASNTVSTSELSNGLYFIAVETSNGRAVKPVIVD